MDTFLRVVWIGRPLLLATSSCPTQTVKGFSDVVEILSTVGRPLLTPCLLPLSQFASCFVILGLCSQKDKPLDEVPTVLLLILTERHVVAESIQRRSAGCKVNQT